MTSCGGFLSFKGSNYFRQRLILSVLTGKPIKISEIRSKDEDPGLKEFEVNLLRLIDKITNGTWLEVSETGTQISFSPGILTGGVISHECCKLRSIGYYLEVVFGLAPFCKKPLEITLTGVTNDETDPSVDAFKTGGLAALKHFLVIDPGIEFLIRKRGLMPEGGGEVFIKFPALRLKAVQKKEFGKIKKVRGNAFALRVPPSLTNRFIESGKGMLLNFIPDVFLTAEHRKGAACGRSPGVGGIMTAETTTGVILTGEAVTQMKGAIAEELGKETAYRLLEQIFMGGLVDSSFQSLVCLYMAMGQKDVSQFVIGPLVPYTIQFLRHLREFLGLVFKIDPYTEADNENEDLKLGSNNVLLTCVGVGYSKFTQQL